MAKQRKPFVSRKRRREIEISRERREAQVQQNLERRSLEPVVVKEKQPIELPPTAMVGDFSKLLNLPVVQVISHLMKNGVMAAVTATIDYDTMAIIADELGFVPRLAEEHEEETDVSVAAPVNEGTVTRPPVVTIMGHVDHGKTSLLDKIRQTNIAGGEAGGITQHIGAYQAEIEHEGKTRLITFLDTPGHEAFSAMRSHGAQVADIAILIVAADDGVKPQTIEAVNHAKAANVPVIVAITKVDLPDANPEKAKQQLTEHGLIAEEWGGDTVFVPVSSKTGQGIPELLEYIILTADLRNYKADPLASPQGVVIESHQLTGLGPIATVLIQNGTLRVGDVIVIGQTFGKIRSMTDYRGQRLNQAGPSTPVVVAGLHDTPDFGEPFASVKSEKEARDLTERSSTKTSSRSTITDISQAIAEGRADTLKIVLKADTQGSIEALRSSIMKLQEPGVKPLIVQSGIGDITISDIQLAQASGAIVLGFHVVVPPTVKKAAERDGVTIATYKIIYELLDQIGATLKGRVRTEKVLVERGRLKVKKVFRTTREMQIIGGEIAQGVALANAMLVIRRGDDEVGKGKVLSLQKGPESVQELEAIQDCGLSVQASEKIQEGDVLVFQVEEEVIATE